jgi:hypothetical protein
MPGSPEPAWQGFAPLLAAILGAAMFAVSLDGVYVYDDPGLILEDPRVQEPARFWELWTSAYHPDSVDNLYRPLTSTSFALQWHLHGDRPWVFHLVNILLHAGNCALVVMLLRRAGEAVRRSPAPLIAGVLFAAHPIHVEAVANLAGRAELLCTLGALLGVVLLLGRPLTVGRSVAIFLCFVLSVLSKEHGMLLPFLILLASRLRPFAPDEKRPVQVLTLLLCLGLASVILVREYALGLPFYWERHWLDWTRNPIVRPDADKYLLPLVLLGRYTALLIFPWKLSVDYGGLVIGWTVRWSDPYFWIGIAALAAWLAILAAALWRRWRVVAFLVLSLGLTYTLASNFIIIIGTIFGERLMYLPSVFFVGLVAMLLAKLPRPAWAIVTLILLLAAGVRTETYAVRWNDPPTFFESALRDQPKSPMAHLMVAVNRWERGDMAGAIEIAEQKRRLYPDYHHAWLLAGYFRMLAGDYDLAEQYFRKAHALAPNPMGVIFYMQQLRQRRADAASPATAPSPATEAPPLPR